MLVNRWWLEVAADHRQWSWHPREPATFLSVHLVAGTTAAKGSEAYSSADIMA